MPPAVPAAAAEPPAEPPAEPSSASDDRRPPVSPAATFAGLGGGVGILGALRVGIAASRSHPALAAGFVVATLAQGVLQGALVWVLREVLVRLSTAGARGADAGNVGLLTTGALTILAVWAMRACANFATESLSLRLAHRVEMDAVRALLAKVLTLSARFFDRTSIGDLVTSAYSDMRGIRNVTLHLASIVTAGARVLGLVAVLFAMSPKLALVGLLAVPVGSLPAYWLGQRITGAARDERRTVTTFYDTFMQVVHGIRVIKVNRSESRVLARSSAIARQLYDHLVRQAQARSMSQFLLESVSGLGLITVLVVGGGDVARGTLPWQSLMSLLVAIMSVYGPMVTLLQVYSSVRSVLPNLERVREIMTAIPEVADAPDARPLAEAPRVIQLDDVWFGYGDGAPVLRGVSGTFYRGETIGVVGPSGSGKSTLLALLLRLYDPTRGRILFDGVDLRAVRHGDLMDLCAIVMQEPFLFLDTVEYNIRTGRPSATTAEVEEAARAANVHDEIVAMERGYDTVMGRRHDARGVSGGQKQRLCIAAALLKNAPILFLDEATSNLDSVSERLVQSAIERLMAGRTTFMIAHRLSTLRTVDRILVLDEGRVVGLAPHAELLTTCPTYRRLWDSQRAERAVPAPGAVPPVVPPSPHLEAVR